MKLYLAGPMTGLPDFNRPAFNKAATQLRAQGLTIINPAEVPLPAPASTCCAGHLWQYYMKIGINSLLDCDGIALLPGWKESEGAQLEVKIAETLHIPVYDFVEELLPIPFADGKVKTDTSLTPVEDFIEKLIAAALKLKD